MNLGIYSFLAASMATPAFAVVTPDVSLAYSDLQASYNAITTLFSTYAVDNTAHQSYGTATRLVTPFGQADFQPGFVSGADAADFMVTMNVTILAPFLAVGTGSFVALDAHGDRIEGVFTGTFTRVAGMSVFTGDLLQTDYFSGDNAFNGSFGLNSFPLFSTPTLGGTITITTPVTGMFRGVSETLLVEPLTTVEIVVGVPTPGAAGLGLAALGLIAGRRRRANG